MKASQISTATTKDLLAFFNAHSGMPTVKKFADRATAERRVAALLSLMPQQAKKAPKAAFVQQFVENNPVCPACGGHLDVTCGEVVETKSGQHIANDHIATHHTCGHVWNMNTGRAVRAAAASASRAEAIAASWQDPAVRAARAQRNGVEVTTPRGKTMTFRSVREAFLELNLPLGQHIRFRGELKAAGSKEFASHGFRVL